MARKKPLAARFNRPITVQSATTAADSYGEGIETWGTYLKAWAWIRVETGTEQFKAQQEVNQHLVKFSIRYSATAAAITEKMRISYDGKIYDIEAVINYNEMNKEIVLHARYRRT